VISGFIDVTRIDDNGVEQTVLGADVAFSTDALGVAISEDDAGVTTYAFENGVTEHAYAFAADATHNDLYLGSDAEDAPLPASLGDGTAFDGLDIVAVTGNEQLAGAIIATGAVVVESDVKLVQHPDGGVVSHIYIHDGSNVEAGGLLLELEGTQLRANLTIVERQLMELGSREARLVAERDNSEDIDFSGMRMDADGSDVGEVLKGELRLFEARKKSRTGTKAQLQERIAQAMVEIDGVEAQIAAKEDEIGLLEEELKGLVILRENALTPETRLKALQRESAGLHGEIGALRSVIAQTKGKIAEIRLQILQIDSDLQSEVTADLRQVHASIGELSERWIAARDQLNRVAIRAPQDGIVHNLSVHIKGEVVGAAQPVMEIVPVSDAMVAEVRVAPADIEQIYLEQPARIRFSAFNQRTTAEVPGFIDRIGADLSTDPLTGLRFYQIRVSPTAAGAEKLAGLRLLPGMPVEVFIETEARTALSYLVKPLADQIERAFKEE
jgi:membrane fusion protein, type I secretion system